MTTPNDSIGIHIATFKLQRGLLWRVLLLPTVAFVLGLGVVVLSLLRPEAIVLSAFGGFVSARAAVFLWQQSAQWGTTTELRSDGLVRHSGDHRRLVPFETIRAINTTGGTLPFYRVEFVHVFTVNHEHYVYAGALGFEFGRLLRLEHAEHATPEYLRKLLSGENLHFGSFAITPDGVQRSTRRVPWRNISGVRWRERDIELLLGTEWRPLANLVQVPNAAIFFQVIKRATDLYAHTPEGMPPDAQ